MPISLSELHNMRTVTLSDGNRYRFGWVDPSQLIKLRAIQDANLGDREFVEQVLSVLIDEPSAAESNVCHLSDSLLIEMAYRYIDLSADHQKHPGGEQLAVSSLTLAEAREALIVDIDSEIQGVGVLAREVMRSVSNISAGFGTTQFDLATSPIWEHLNSVGSITTSYVNLLKQYESPSQNLVSPFPAAINSDAVDLADSWIGTQSAISNFYTNAVSETSGITDNFLSAFGAITPIDLPSVTHGWASLLNQGIFEQFEELREEYRATFLIEANLQLLNDFSESAIDDIVDNSQFIPDRQRNAYVARRLHSFTSDVTFIRTLSHELSAVRKARSRTRILHDIHAAHTERRYYLSIPALLAQVEGLAAQFMAEMGFIRWDRQDRKWYEVELGTRRYRLVPVYKKGVDSGDKKRVPVQGLGNLGQMFSKVNSNVLPNTLPHIRDDMPRFRNQVMHGSMTNYGSSRRSSVLLVLALLLIQQLRKLEQGA